MCNEAARRRALNLIREDFSQLKIRLVFPEGLPNLASLDSIRITDPTLIVRVAREGAEDEAEAVMRRWSWPGPGGRPVFNYRSEGREFRDTPGSGRCLIPLDGFYEFTAPEGGKGRKDKWLFTMPGERDEDMLFCVAGMWRDDPAVGEAFTMLTCDPGPDIAPYHSRQIALLARDHWSEWLGGAPAAGLARPTSAGALRVSKVETAA